jgi:hypothetical protein
MYRQKIFKPRLNFFQSNQEMLVSFGVALLCCFFSLFFPAQNSAQILTKNLFFLVLLPALYIKFILQQDLSDFGWNLKNKTGSVSWGIVTTIFTLLLFYLMLKFTLFGTNYALGDYVKNSFWLFLAYELLIVNFSLFIFSYFFQGFLLFTFQKKFESWAIAAQAILFFAFLFFTKSLSWQVAPFILLSITGGFLSYKTKSFLYSYFMSIFVIIILDTYIIYLTK